MFESVLVANRGEIAVRVIRTLRLLGIRSVAVYSDADSDARHVRDADVAIRLGAAPAHDSYLNIERLVTAAISTGAQAVHPGYGFLAENASFARACTDAGLVFVGPPADAMEIMGDKISAKQTVRAAGVPVVPGRDEPGMADAALVEAAAEIGYPVLVKPSAGGGGKGMRLVHEAHLLPDALVSARREAASSFGDDTLFVERFVLRPRHIEVQVLADTHGTVLSLGERECSLQRRHQKIIEEAPSVLLSSELRETYGALAVATAEAVAYTGAGTVEFIVAGDLPGEPFFMEMNTRLQVEHPVTELVTGLDLVEQQLRVAAGEPLGFSQSDVQLTGHAVEARLYAEAPALGFIPTGGVPLLVREPSGGGVRVDSSLVEGVEVGMTYDPMLSKIIAWAPDRETALAGLSRALSDTVVLGVGTNTRFLQALVEHPEVRAGRLDTVLVERELDLLVAAPVPDLAYAGFALAKLLSGAASASGPWDQVDGWRPSGAAATTWRLSGGAGVGAVVTVRAIGSPSAAEVAVDDGPEVTCHAEPAIDGFLLTMGDRTVKVLSAIDGDHVWLHIDGTTYELTEAPPARVGAAEEDHDGELISPMPGAVVAVSAVLGAQVREGDVLVVVEAMKMEHSLTAPFDGEVGELGVRTGDKVAVGQHLVTVVRAS